MKYYKSVDEMLENIPLLVSNYRKLDQENAILYVQNTNLSVKLAELENLLSQILNVTYNTELYESHRLDLIKVTLELHNKGK